MTSLKTSVQRIFVSWCRIRVRRGQIPLAIEPQIIQNIPVPQTTGTGFDSLFSLRRVNRRPLAVFHLLAMSPLGGSGGGAFGHAGTRKRQSVNPAICCPPSFDSDAGGSTAYGGHDMAALPISAHSAHITFPLTQREARHCARLWFTGTPHLTLAEWRDNRCRAHCTGLPNYMERVRVFHEAFAVELATIIAGVRHE